MATEETKTIFTRQDGLIASVYEKSRPMILGYISRRIGSRSEAEDLTQDLFCRMLECNYFLNEDTIMYFIFSIARNLVIDWLRRHARREAAADYFFVHARRESRRTEEEVEARELEIMERQAIAELPKRRQQVYCLCVLYGMPAPKVAERLQLSRRTVENHLFAARTRIRLAMKDQMKIAM